jgi:hypothetical protein
MKDDLEKVEYGRLTPGFVHKLKTGEIKTPTREKVFGTGNKRKLEGSEHAWTLLLAGESVNWRYVVALLDALLRHRPVPLITQEEAEAAAERIDPEVEPVFDLFAPDALRVGWGGVKKWYGNAHQIPAESFCYGNEDRLEMADMLLDCIGRKGTQRGHAISDTAARKAGERLAGIEFDALVKWLTALQRKNRRTAMFAVDNVIDGTERRIRHLGVTIALPLMEGAYTDFREGKLAYPSITPEMICEPKVPSRHILLHSFSEIRHSEYKHRKKISFAQVRTALYQMAVHCPVQLSMKKASPSVLCLCFASAGTGICLREG